jgi:hypothetical protein
VYFSFNCEYYDFIYDNRIKAGSNIWMIAMTLSLISPESSAASGLP